MIDIYFARTLSRTEITAASSKVFPIKQEQVDVITYRESWESALKNGVQLLWEIYPPMRGAFPMRVSIVPLSDQVVYRDEGQIIQIIGDLCEALNCPAFANHGIHNVNPYIWILINGSRDYQKVAVDLNKLDSDDELEIVSYYERCIFD